MKGRHRLGLLFSSTGPYATIGQAMLNGALLAIDEVNGSDSFPFALGIGYVPQGREIFHHMTVEENLRMGRLIRRQTDKALAVSDDVYGYFPFLKERQAQRAGTLSGGQQEMLAVARALNGDPALLLLDEPSDGVQPSIVQEIGDFLVKLVADRAIGILIGEQNIGLPR